MEKRASVRRRILRLAVCVPVGLVLGLFIYVGLVQTGLVRSPFAPSLAGDVALARSDRTGLRVLFVGNSLTYWNSMPRMVGRLAAADDGAPALFAVRYTAPGWRLRQAARDDALARLLETVPWDIVVLQENSRVPSWPSSRRHELTPSARVLHTKIRASGARTVLFMTWGWRHGDSHYAPGDSYEAMQERLEKGYSKLGYELPAPVSPVGVAWAEALRRDPRLELWDDGVHPSRLGSYLAACVLYATLSGRDPRHSAYTAELREAGFLQDVAADVVNGAS